MSTLHRAIRNVARKPARSAIVVLIVGASLGIFLSMSVIGEAIESEALAVAGSIDTSLTVRAAGSGSGGGLLGAEPVPVDVGLIPLIELTDGVERVDAVALQTVRPAFDRAQGGTIDREALRAQFLTVQGVTVGGDPFLQDGSDIELVAGRVLAEDDHDVQVVLLGSDAADRRGLGLNGSLEINGDAYTVVGVFDSTTFSGNTTAIVPLDPMLSTWNLTGPTSLVVHADDVGAVASVERDLAALVGDDYEVVTASDTETEMLQSHIDSIAGSSAIGSWLALSTGLLVLVFLMILVTRERTREIGVMKALGFNSGRIIQQLLAESVALATGGFVVALLFAVLAGPALSGILVDSTRDDADGSGDGAAAETAGARSGRPGLPGFTSASTAAATSSLEDVAFHLSADLVLSTLAVALVVGALGGLYPVLKAVRLQPAEALRYE